MVFTTTLPLTPTHGGIDVCLLDTAGKIAEVVALFKSNAVTTIAVDIEGRNLGRGGLIATIQLHAPESPTTVYVVDVVAVGATQTFSHETGLKELLESSQVTKLFFDVRSDANALFHLHGVRMSGVFDLQLLHIASQIARGEKIPTHLTGLAKVIQGLTTSFLSPAARSRMDWNKREAQSLFTPQQGGSYDVWFTRPLSAILIEYLTDVHIFSHLYAVLLSERQLVIHRPAIERASSRRLQIGHGLAFSKDNPRNKYVDDRAFIDAIVSNSPVWSAAFRR